MVKVLGGLCAAVLLVPAVGGAAMIDFSDLSSDETDPSVLDARWVATVNGDELTLQVTNLTAPPSGYTVSELYFNILGDVDARTLVLATKEGFPEAKMNVEEAVPGNGNAPGNKAGGFGRLDIFVDLAGGNTGVAPGASTTLVFSGVSGLGDDLLNELSENPPGDFGVTAVTKFTQGPGGDSAFGSGSIVPEPAMLVILGLVMLVTARTRTR